MKSILTSSLIILSISIATPAISNSYGYKSTIKAPLSTAVKIEVLVSEDMIHRANNLPKKMSDRGNARSLRSGFSGNGFYGDREIGRLEERLEYILEKRLSKKGIKISDTAQTTLRVTIEDAKPNRPTFNQLSKEPSLSYKSFSNGGAELEAELVSANGQSLGNMSYRFYENDIREAQFRATWSDAHRAFGRFANRAAKTLAN